MYWFRADSLIGIASFILTSCMWALGGWLLVTHAFRLRQTERLLAGLTAGFLLYIEISNLIAQLIPVAIAFWAASLSILVAGVALAWRSKRRPALDFRDFKAFYLLIALATFTALFTLILRGQAIFDEYLHLPLISIMAAGDIPPHFYLNPGLSFAYHYALQLYAASMVRLANFFPWSAWDVSRAFTFAITLVLGWVWIRRITLSRLAGWVGSFLLTFAGGARFLLLLLPPAWLAWVSASVNLTGTGLDTASTLADALHKVWVIEGGGPVGFPFAFHNGIFVPAFFILGSTAAMPFMTILLLLLLVPRGRFSNSGVIIWSLILASLALSAEHHFAVLWAGIAIVLLVALLYRKRLYRVFTRQVFIQWGIILAVSSLLSLIQGGFITETARNLLASLSGTASQSYNADKFSIRWPPGFVSAHLGSLSIFNPGQLVALLAEVGPAILFVPVIFIRFKKQLVHKDFFTSGMAVSVVIGLLVPFFLQYGVDRRITRLPATALWTVLLLAFPILWKSLPHLNNLTRIGLAAAYVIMVIPGIVIFRTQLYSTTTAVYTYYIDGLDAGYSVDYWNKLPTHAQILDRIPERSVTIFGRISRAYSGIYDPLPEWQALIADPDPARVSAAGYDYIYMDNKWWEGLTTSQQAYFLLPCVDIMDRRSQDNNQDYRLLMDVSACKP
jgi:hypothetical protein